MTETQAAVLKNPFTPEFGRVPEYLAGRQAVIDALISALEHGLGSPELCSILVGARGCGKTVMLSLLSQEAQGLGWVSADVASTPGMLEDIIQRTEEAAAHLITPAPQHQLSGVQLAGVGGVSWESCQEQPNWRSRMNALLNKLEEHGTGLLITVDEVNPNLDEMVQLVSTYQLFIRENRKVALFMAGLPHNVSAIIAGESTSFLRRAARFDLGPLPGYEVEEAVRLTVESAGRTISQPALDAAVQAIGGFPFMLQLVGYRAWNAAGRDAATISEEAMERGIALARQELDARVYDATYASLSEGDRAFIAAMAQDEERTLRADLTKRLGKSSGYVSTYKRRLLDAGVIEEPRPGVFTFALPGFRSYVLRQQ